MSVGAFIVVGIIAFISFIYTILTLPIYFFVQQPWKMRMRIKDVKVSLKKGEIENFYEEKFLIAET